LAHPSSFSLLRPEDLTAKIDEVGAPIDGRPSSDVIAHMDG
jgi:hypothetical protein